MLQALLLVMLGGAVGSGARYLITHFSSRISHGHGFPYGTLAVNVIGSFIVGYVLTWSADHTHDRWHPCRAGFFLRSSWRRIAFTPPNGAHHRPFAPDGCADQRCCR